MLASRFVWRIEEKATRERSLARTLGARIFRKGRRVTCTVCGETFARFAAGPGATPNRRCWSCGSLERHRQIALLFKSQPPLLNSRMSLLHIAPEASIHRMLPAGCDYTCGDLDPSHYPGAQRIDATDMHQFANDRFDALVCVHVMEHIPDDRAAMREFHRVLKPKGWGLVMTPIVTDVTDEDPTVTDPAERLRRFGQADHVRRYGWDYVDRLEASGFAVRVVRLEEELAPSDVDRFRLRNVLGEVEPLFLVTAQ
jgi:hypothetical protein